MFESISIISLSAGQRVPYLENTSEDLRSEQIFCTERTSFGCFHEYKAQSILKRPVKEVSYTGSCTLCPPFSNSDALFVFPSYENICVDKCCSIFWFISNRSSPQQFEKLIYVGERSTPAFNMFLLYAYPMNSYIFEDDEVIDVTSESVRIISHRYSLSQKVSSCSKVGCLVDSAAGINSDIITQLYRLGSRHDFKVYPISIGRIEDYKLGNFGDLDIFVNLQCQFCFEFREKYSTPVLSYYEFITGLLDCFWDYRYGEFSALLLHENCELIKPNIAGYIENKSTDFSGTFSCNPTNILECEENVEDDVEIHTGQYGTPKAYHILLSK
jgi:hypothetical protein